MATAVEEFGTFASANMIDEATAFKTVTPGFYEFRGNKIYGFDDEKGTANIGGKVFAGGLSRGNVFIRLQWKETRTASGKLTQGCKLYGQALKALYPNKPSTELAKINPKEVVDNLMKYPVNVLVSEYYSVPDPTNQYGSRRERPKSPEEVAAVRQLGGIAKNEVLVISPFKG